MKKVLIIAYNFPPGTEVGSLRPLGLAKNLYQYGWEPIVLTIKKPDSSRKKYESLFKVIETEPFDIFTFFRKIFWMKLSSISKKEEKVIVRPKNRLTSKIHYMFKAIFAFPDRHIGWYVIAAKAANKLLIDEQVDLILSTSCPWTSALVARKLCVKYKMPWIADFRDLWSQHHRKEFKWIRNCFDRILEKWTLNKASRLVVVSAERAKKWALLHKKKQICAITLGFHEDDFATKGTWDFKTSEFVICYAGKIKGMQYPDPLFLAISDLKNEGKIPIGLVKLKIWGESEFRIQKMVKELHLEDTVTFMPRISRDEIIREMQRSSILLNLNWDDPTEKGVHPGKMFDYLGARRPILSVGSQIDVVTEMLMETKSGIQLWEKEELKQYLLDRVSEFKKLGEVPYLGDPDIVNQYGYKAITKKFADLMDEAIHES